MFGVTRWSWAPGITVLAIALHPPAASAQGQSGTALRVGATVAPRCTISVDDTTVTDDRSPSVHVVCSRSGLRALRVTTSRGEGLEPLTTFASSQLRAGGEVVFVVPVALAEVASRVPVAATTAPIGRRAITVTLDF